MEMKEEALKLAEQLEDDAKYGECDWTNPKVSADMIRRLVEELDKQGEPVAWMQTYEIGITKTKEYTFEFEKVFDTDIPLYTTPQTKLLSDEEIIAIADRLSLIHYYDSDCHWSGITNENMIEVEQNRNDKRLLEILKPFARAIEERHGIK